MSPWGGIETRRSRTVGRWTATYVRKRGSPWGRFGGGWDWSVGVIAGGSTVIINLLVCSVRIDRARDRR